MDILRSIFFALGILVFGSCLARAETLVDEGVTILNEFQHCCAEMKRLGLKICNENFPAAKGEQLIKVRLLAEAIKSHFKTNYYDLSYYSDNALTDPELVAPCVQLICQKFVDKEMDVFLLLKIQQVDFVKKYASRPGKLALPFMKRDCSSHITNRQLKK